MFDQASYGCEARIGNLKQEITPLKWGVEKGSVKKLAYEILVMKVGNRICELIPQDSRLYF